jgi:hypothetical protein
MNASRGPRWWFKPRTVGRGISETIDMDKVVELLGLARLPALSVNNRWLENHDYN